MGSRQEQAANSTALGVYLPRLQTSILQDAGGSSSTTIHLNPDAAPDLTPEQALASVRAVPAAYAARPKAAPGDRTADCGSSMEPIAVTVRGDGEWVLVHRCLACEIVHLNRSAGDDNPLLLLRLAVRPLARPPFPLEHLSQI